MGLADYVQLIGSASGTEAGPVTAVSTFSAQPSGTLLMAFVMSGAKSSMVGPGGPGTPPTGWTMLVHQYQYPAAQDASYHVIAKIADGTETSLTVTTNTTDITGDQAHYVGAIDALSNAAFTGFGGVLQGPSAVDNTAATSYLDSAAMVAEVATNVRIDVVGGNLAVSSSFDLPSPTPDATVTIASRAGNAVSGAFGVFAFVDHVGAGATLASRRYTSSLNRPESINSFLCQVPAAARTIRRIDFR